MPLLRIDVSIVTVGCLGLAAGLFISYAQEPSRVIIPTRTDGELAKVSGASPYPVGCQGQQTGTDFIDYAVEPSVAVDPTNSKHLIGVWQQNRWSNGGADGLMTAVSMDGGVAWTRVSVPFTQCSGGTFLRASDPWVTISPNGTAYQSAIAIGNSIEPAGVLVSRSIDGGSTWEQPIAVASDTAGDDEESITADPANANYVYAIWDDSNYAAIFSRTSDGGITWSHPKSIYSALGCCNQIVVLPNGTLVDVFEFYNSVNGSSYIENLQSTDHGDTWTGPFIVSIDESINVVDARTQTPIRTGNGIPNTAIDPRSGAIYIVWQDSRFSNGQRDGIAFSRSLNGGTSWSNPVQVNQVPQVQAFNPAVAVGPDGSVAITYFDFRQAGTDTNSLETSYWQIVSPAGSGPWRETPVAGPFDMLRAAHNGSAYFIGDYQALVAAGDGFVPFFAATNSGSTIGSSIFALPRERRGSLAWNGRTELNEHPQPFSARRKPKGNRKR